MTAPSSAAAAPRIPTAPRSTRPRGGRRCSRRARACWTAPPRSAVAGQQHGMVALDEAGEVVRPALLWNDLRSAAAATELVAERAARPGGRSTWAASPAPRSPSPSCAGWPTTSRTTRPRTAAVLLPHDWLTARLRSGGRSRPDADLVTDRGDASGTGYCSPRRAAGCPTSRRPRSATDPAAAGRRPAEVVGQTAAGAALSAGTGDNMAAALGLGLQPGDVAVSIGTSGTAFAVSAVPAATRPARSPASPTPPAGSCRWSARSTRPWCWPRRPGCWAPT